MKIFNLLLLSLLLISCGTETGKAELKQTWHMPEFTTKIHIIPSNKIIETCTALGVEYTANGCSAIDTNKKICNVYVMPQRYQQDSARLEIIGHEIWHCVYGYWHD